MIGAVDTLTFLFTDIEGSSRLWEERPDRMTAALARHDAIIREAVEAHRGRVVKMLGDGVDAVFEDPLDGVNAILDIQLALADPGTTAGLPLKIRSALHAGVVEVRDKDFFGQPVNRAARLMSSAHGGQILLSQAVVQLVADRLPVHITLRELGHARLRDLATPERVFQLVHEGLRKDFPALRALAETPNNLVQQLSSLVGRESEIAEVRSAISTARLVTLVGPGGIGKTRIAKHAAAALIGEFTDGVWFVDLAPLTQAQLLASTLSSVLGVEENPQQALLDTIVAHLAGQRALIVLDNCEHLAQAAAVVAVRILERAPHVRILATSREPLRIAAERIYVVPALSFPQAEEAVESSELPRYDAVRLFIDRATSARPSFRPTDDVTASICDICRRLDGIPLAIELAAARVRTLPVSTIASRLNDRFSLLTTGGRDALPRQQTLRALIDWSYETLSDAERTLLNRLAVFAGGWTLEAAEAVGSGGRLAPEMVMELQSNLVEKSLVSLDPAGSRYAMLETVRAYARERLDATGELGDLEARHLTHYLALAVEARSQLYGGNRTEWLLRLDRDRENMLAAHRYCDSATDGGLRGLQLARAVADYLFVRGGLTVAHQVILEALGRPAAQARTEQRARALFDLGQLECFMGRYAEARVRLSECVEIAVELGDRRRLGEALQPLAMAVLGLGDTAAALAHLEEACEIAREGGDKREIAAALIGLVQVLRMDSRFDDAEPLGRQAVSIAREIADHDVLLIGLMNLAMVELARSRVSQARTLLREVAELSLDANSTPIFQSTLDVAAALACETGEVERAGRYFHVVEANRASTGLQRDPADEAFIQPYIGRAQRGVARPLPDPSKARDDALIHALNDARTWLAQSSL